MDALGISTVRFRNILDNTIYTIYTISEAAQILWSHPSIKSVKVGSKLVIPFVLYIFLPRLRPFLFLLFVDIFLPDSPPPSPRLPIPLVGWGSKFLFATVLSIRGLDSTRSEGFVESVLCLIVDILSWIWVASDPRIRQFGGTIAFDTVARDSIIRPARRSVALSSDDVYGCLRAHAFYIRHYMIGLVSWVVMYVLRSGVSLGALWWSIAVAYIPRFWIVFLIMQGACAVTAYGDAVSPQDTDAAHRSWDDTLRVYASRLTTIPTFPAQNDQNNTNNTNTPHFTDQAIEHPTPMNPDWKYPPKIDQEQTMKMLDTILSSALNDVFVKTKAA